MQLVYNSSSFYTGQNVHVAYNKESPQIAILQPEVKAYIIMIGFIIAGTIILCMKIVS